MNVTIKDLPSRLHRKLRARADARRRSINSEVIDILESVLESHPVNVDALNKEVDAIHARLNVSPLTDDVLNRAKNEGRR